MGNYNGVHSSCKLLLSTKIIKEKHVSLENFKLVSQQYRTWSDCMDVQDGLALYWQQRLITFGFPSGEGLNLKVLYLLQKITNIYEFG